MRKLLGSFAAVWGAVVVIYGLFLAQIPPNANPNYQAGHMMGTVLGGLMCGAGLYYLFQGNKPTPE